MSDKVSVIIPSYNHGRFLRACIESALAQTHQNLEIIVIDDCSMDDSMLIAQSIKDPRLQVRRNKKNLGTYGTQAAGLEFATGEWISILDSDDIWLPDKVEKQIKALEQHRGQWCYTLGQMVDAEDKVIDKDVHADWPRTEVQDLLPRLLDVNRVLASSLMFKRGATSFRPELRFCGDWVAILWLAEQGAGVCVPEELTLWRQHDTNSYRRSNALTLEEILVRRAILDRREEWLAKAKDKEGTANGLSACALALSALYVLIGQMRMARAAAKMASNLRPASGLARKRRLVAAMPKKIAQRRLWPSEPPVSVDPESLKAKPEILTTS